VRIAIITRNMPPHACGIGDHTQMLARSLRACGQDVGIFAGRGEEGADIQIIGDDWSVKSLSDLEARLTQWAPDHVLLQYTPLMYCLRGSHKPDSLVTFWEYCSEHWKTSLIVHETYFREIWYPPSWFKGSAQKSGLKKLARCSSLVFSASQPLVQEMANWHDNASVYELPIGSNFEVVQCDVPRLRREHGIRPEEIVLTIFGGGTSLKWLAPYIRNVERVLVEESIPVRWLFLGGVGAGYFKLELPVISPGRLPSNGISAWLQASDIFVMPHYAGVCAKRGTLMAAMQHGLPVVGTKGAMTDSFWYDVPGVRLASMFSPKQFARLITSMLHDSEQRLLYGAANRDYYNTHFAWDKISAAINQKMQAS
jgi:glycosyltransferase involved in cell wall biosynthesis